MQKILNASGQTPVKRIGILIQCREGSKRLPNKWKAKIEGEPMLMHVMARCNQARFTIRHPNLSCMMGVVIPEKDSKLEDYLIKNKIDYFKGSEDDVLQRYVQASDHWNLDYIVRVTADCPIIPPRIIGSCIQYGLIGGFDYISNTIVRTYIDGWDVEYMSKEGLRWLDKNSPRLDREHVTSCLLKKEYYRMFEDGLKIDQFYNDLDQSDIKLSVDTKKDLEVVKNEFLEISKKQKQGKEMHSAGSVNKQQTSH